MSDSTPVSLLLLDGLIFQVRPRYTIVNQQIALQLTEHDIETIVCYLPGLQPSQPMALSLATGVRGERGGLVIQETSRHLLVAVDPDNPVWVEFVDAWNTPRRDDEPAKLFSLVFEILADSADPSPYLPMRGNQWHIR